MDKKGFVRTLEAVIAVLLLLAFLYVLFPEKQAVTGETPVEVREAQRYILKEISLNRQYRDCVTVDNQHYSGKCQGGCLTPLQDFIQAQAPFGYATSCEVCNSALSCTDIGFPLDRSVFADSIFISKNAVTKVLRIYFYEDTGRP